MDYEQGLQKLATLLSNEQFTAVWPHVQELQRMIKEGRLHGPAPETTQKRLKAIGQLNQYMLTNFENLSFNDLCRITGQ